MTRRRALMAVELAFVFMFVFDSHHVSPERQQCLDVELPPHNFRPNSFHTHHREEFVHKPPTHSQDHFPHTAKPTVLAPEQHQQQQRHSLESSPTTFATTATTNNMEIDDEGGGGHVPPVISCRHQSSTLKPMNMVGRRQEQRDQSETSEATSSSDSSSSFLSSSCSSSVSTAASTLADSISNDDSCSPRSTLSPLHRALRDYSMDALLASSVASRAVLEHDLLQLITAETACVFDDTTGHLPLHLACRAGLPYAVVERLVMVYPAAVRIATHDKYGLLPLHILCRYYAGSNRERTKLLGFLLRRYPGASRIITSGGELPLHLLCHNYFCSTTDLALLIKYYPHAIATPTQPKRQNLPIHIACGTKYMVREQHQRRPRLAKRGGGIVQQQQVEDVAGSSSDEIIQFLVQQHPTSLTTVNGKGELPFHAAIRGYQSLATLRFLLQQADDPTAAAITATDNHGRTALHLAVSRHEPCRLTIRALLDTLIDSSTTPMMMNMIEAALSAADSDGKTPLDYANQQAESWVRELLLLYRQPQLTTPATTTTTTVRTPSV
jgi:Ankyrin repeats (3 copies)